MHFLMIINTFYKNHLEKLIATFLSIDSLFPIVILSAKLFVKTLKLKQDLLVKTSITQSKTTNRS